MRPNSQFTQLNVTLIRSECGGGSESKDYEKAGKYPTRARGASLLALVASSWIPGALAQTAPGMKLMALLPQHKKDLLMRSLQSKCLHQKESEPLCKSLRSSGMAIPHGLPDRPVLLPRIGAQSQPTGGFKPSVVGQAAQPAPSPVAGGSGGVSPMAQPTQAPYGYANWPLPQPFCPSKYSPLPWTKLAYTPWNLAQAPWDPTASATVWYFNRAKSTPVGQGAGVDTHVIHFHLSNVQGMNRYDIAGGVYLPDDDEKGWKESVKVNPFTTTFVMMQPKLPPNGSDGKDGPVNARKWRSAGWSPSSFPSMVRPADVTMPVTTGRNPTNPSTNYDGEYVWRCHLLGHEENDMMRPIVFR